MDILETIKASSTSFNTVRKRIASVILDNPSRGCFLSLKDFASLCEVSEVTVLKFCKDLGLDNYIALRKQLQEYVIEWAKPSDRIKLLISNEQTIEDSYAKIAASERTAVEETFKRNDPEVIVATISCIKQAKNVFVVAHNASRIVSSYFIYRMRSLGKDIRELEMGEVHQSLTCLSSVPVTDTVLVAIATTPYGSSTLAAAKLCHEMGVTTISLTDSSSSPLVPYSDSVLICPSSESFGGLTNAYTPFIAMVETISLLYHFDDNSSNDELLSSFTEKYYKIINELL